VSARVRWIALGVGLVVLVLSIVLAMNVGGTEPTVGRSVINKSIDWKVTTLDGKEVNSANQLGKTVVVNFWNTWCEPCLEEAPALEEFYERHKDDPDFVMLGIVRDDEEPAVRAYVDDEQIGWDIAVNKSEREAAALAFGVTGQPETFVIGPDGRVAGEQRGETSLADLETMLQAARTGA
jgi:cytochrome c biogenesis protein CcmG, thiol:disulfide interchange protein DsbE